MSTPRQRQRRKAEAVFQRHTSRRAADPEDSSTKAVSSPEPTERESKSGRGKVDITKSRPSLDPYVGKLERYELFSTNQCYYLVACDRHNTAYRVLKMDRTLIERPVEEVLGIKVPRMATPDAPAPPAADNPLASIEATHTRKPTLRPLSEFLTEDPHIYSQAEIEEMLEMIHHGNRFMRADRKHGEASGSSGGLKPIVKAYGIVGFVRFLDCYYLTLITRRHKVGNIGGNGVYTIKSTETFPLKPAEKVGNTDHPDNHADPSSMLLSMWNRGKRSVGLGLTNREIAELRYQGLYQVVDLTKNFYFSYTYDLTRSLQENFLATTSQPFPPPPVKDMYAWNFFLTRELEECTNSLTSYHWVMPIIHGAFIQRKLIDYGRSLNLILIARRSRHFAGTRYLKRGVSEQGKVANDVEHEQILHDESSSTTSGVFSSYLQVRGSIPTFWTQESSVTMPKPPIELNRVDPTYRATQKHFEDLFKRYGSPLVVLDLVKQSEKREREVRVGNEFRHAIDYINTSIDEAHKIRYCALDYSHISKHRNLDVSASLNEVSTWSVNQTGFFCSAPSWKILENGNVEPFGEDDKKGAKFMTEQLGVPVFPMEQKGVLRTNCIDCLDRTNVAQFSAGVEALEQQLVVMGIRSSSKLDSSSNIIRVLIEMYVEIGDHIALQYGGSEAHKKVVSTERSESIITGPMGKHKELLTSIRRYYSNAFTDRLKQDAMNLLLGYYIPYRHSVPLWEMETDYYLHNMHIRDGRSSLNSMKTYERTFGMEWSDDGDRSPSKLNPQRAMKQAEASSGDALTANDSSDAWRIERVRRRCGAQNEALSAWWKVAIQANIQQRMWMRLGRSTSESFLPPRFERIYQPDKLAHFDKLFARSWAIPVRRSHSAQHISGPDDESEMTEYRRTISGRASSAVGSPSNNKGNDLVDESGDQSEHGETTTVGDFLRSNGFEPHVAPSLTKFMQPFGKNIRSSTIPSRDGAIQEKKDFSSDSWFIGSLADRQEPSEIYIRYSSSTAVDSPSQTRQTVLSEFRKCLADTSLDSDDVDGIRKLAESAHIGERIRTGPYRGLSQHESAIEVTTVIHEQFNVLSNMRSKGHLRKGPTLVDNELRRRNVYTSGVKEAVAEGWERWVAAQKQYAEIVDNSNAACRRSDLTSEESMRVYSSFYDGSTPMSQLDVTYMLGETPPSASSHDALQSGGSSKFDYQEEHTMGPSFVERAARLGVTIPSSADIEKQKAAPLFSFERRRGIPSGFEQINDDLFARTENKFMVLNGSGIDSWHGTQPVTKVSGIEEDVLVS